MEGGGTDGNVSKTFVFIVAFCGKRVKIVNSVISSLVV